jgi:hypothetical protein
MGAVFLLHHVRSDDEYADNAKLIGTYSSRDAAVAAIERLREQRGFRDHPEGWDIQQYILDDDHWEEGFVTAPDRNLVTFRYEPEDEWNGKLIVGGESGDFTGVGEAWFASDVLRQFADACEAYPLKADAPPTLRGGYWDDDGSVLREPHISIVLEPHDARGLIRAVVELATDTYTADERAVAQSVTIRFLLIYADLATFAPHFRLHIEGKETAMSLSSSL